jgi:rhodanese-related sulfurtransferase
VALKLIEMGFAKVYTLKGGWKEWSKNNYPTEKK